MKSVNIFCQTIKIIDITVAFSVEQKFNIVAHIIESKTTEAGLFVLEKSSESVMKAIKNCTALYLSPLKPKNSLDWEFLDRCESKLIEITEFDPTGDNILLCGLRLFAKKSLIEPSFNLLVKPLLSHATKGIMINQTAYPKDYLDTESIPDGSVFRLSLDDKPVRVRPLGNSKAGAKA